MSLLSSSSSSALSHPSSPLAGLFLFTPPPPPPPLFFFLSGSPVDLTPPVPPSELVFCLFFDPVAGLLTLFLTTPTPTPPFGRSSFSLSSSAGATSTNSGPKRFSISSSSKTSSEISRALRTAHLFLPIFSSPFTFPPRYSSSPMPTLFQRLRSVCTAESRGNSPALLPCTKAKSKYMSRSSPTLTTGSMRISFGRASNTARLPAQTSSVYLRPQYFADTLTTGLMSAASILAFLSSSRCLSLSLACSSIFAFWSFSSSCALSAPSRSPLSRT
mmetsp:Transcript_18392/g.37556  ORF Transcript_18392/g.37556 Transcript_18392/m.37556 type:complete len:273 (-) Transcript_18392:561-1379(-)